MAIPFILGVVAAGGAVATGGAMYDMSRAKDINKEAQDIADSATRRRDNARRSTNNSLENLGKTKISIMKDNMKVFVENFSKLKNVKNFHNSIMLDELRDFNPQSKEFLDMKSASFKASELATGGLGSIAAGTLTAAGAYGAVGAFATASTGAAISGLAGAAATNATLAWLGGGAVAAGGGGVAAGTMVLGGLVAAPALLVSGLFLTSKSDKALNDACANRDKAKKYEQEVRNLCSAMDAIKEKTNQIDDLLKKLNNKFSPAVSNMLNAIRYFGTDFSQFSEMAQNDVGIAMQLARTTKKVIDTPLMNQQGGVSYEAQNLLTSREVKVLLD